MVPLPQLPLSPLGVATTRPAGNVSVNATPVSAVPAFGLVTVKVSDVEAPMTIDAAPNAFARVGTATAGAKEPELNESPNEAAGPSVAHTLPLKVRQGAPMTP